MEQKKLEKYSSAFTLSDMEIFVFPDLLYALVLANIMSPEIWKWREDPWFAGISKMGPLKKIQRVKQYIMDHYDFNLDLETWGLTDKETEIRRFEDFIDIDVLERSNALFGYAGDKYYFELDIRRHFGLDKYDSDIIPYWKTETVEAMNAFRHKPNHLVGAGECVSLACLYAAALFIVAGIPPEKIFLMGTPLHSQNFILVDEGILTNNRRIVTRNMWYNGTELSALARRALEHEQVTFVAHHTGWIHTLYPEATIDPAAFHHFHEKLNRYLETSISFEIFMNFLRDYSRYQKYFQIGFICQGSEKYIRLEKAFGYEHGSKRRLGSKSGNNILCEMDEEDLYLHPVNDRSILLENDELFQISPYPEFVRAIKQRHPELAIHEDFFADLKKFVHTVPRLPSANKHFTTTHTITFSPAQSREEIIRYLEGIRSLSTVADLAFYAGRYMDSCDWQPFLKAAFERNPVSILYFKELELPDVYRHLQTWRDGSIYEGNRLALPDEVVNFTRGDGIEKAITLANVAKARHLVPAMEQHDDTILLRISGQKYEFRTTRTLRVPVLHKG